VKINQITKCFSQNDTIKNTLHHFVYNKGTKQFGWQMADGSFIFG
jgi:hypothetical protein